MNISVIICTYNRSHSLQATLRSLEDMVVPCDLDWELILVDNNSNDNTSDVIATFIKSTFLNARYVFEGEQGLSNARNKGLMEAGGDIIVFTDDDVIVDKAWLASMARVFSDKEVACAGGPIYPIWEVKCPKWLTAELYPYIALLDLGNKVRQLEKPTLWGANMAFKAEMFKKYGNFDARLGRTAGKLYSAEETQFINKLMENEEKIIYCPNIKVHHFIPEKRMKKSYFRKWTRDSGELVALTEAKKRGGKALLVCYRILTLLVEMAKLTFKLPGVRNNLESELVFWWQVGFVLGTIRR